MFYPVESATADMDLDDLARTSARVIVTAYG